MQRVSEKHWNKLRTRLTVPVQAIISPVAPSSNESGGMALRPIITLPDPKLRLVSRKIERIDDSLRRLIDDMIETMHEAPGVGLAAIQVGEPIRVLVVDVAK